MAQNPADLGPNALSPHSSSGGAESFRGTPDTRLTAFSPDDGSAKSSRILGVLRAASAGVQPVQFPVRSSTESSAPGVEDPFVTSTRTLGAGARGLSATATEFQPSLSALIARGSLDKSSPTRTGQFTASEGRRDAFFPVRVPSPPQFESASPSHCLEILASPGTDLSVADIEHYVTVRPRLFPPLAEQCVNMSIGCTAT